MLLPHDGVVPSLGAEQAEGQRRSERDHLQKRPYGHRVSVMADDAPGVNVADDAGGHARGEIPLDVAAVSPLLRPHEIGDYAVAVLVVEPGGARHHGGLGQPLHVLRDS